MGGEDEAIRRVSFLEQYNSFRQQKSARETYRPEVVNKYVEDAENNHQHNRAPLGLESNYNHDTSTESQYANQYPPEVPVTSEDKSNKQEDQKNSSGKLEVHLAILLVDLW